MLELAAGQVRALIDPERGGRIVQLSVGGLDLLVADAQGVFDWGLFVMAPFAGRIRSGRFQAGGEAHELRLNLPPHAIHGTTLDRPWAVVEHGAVGLGGLPSAATLEIALGTGWPFAGRVRHRVALGPDRLDLEIVLLADEAMPVAVGWHPWFRRQLARGEPLRLELPAGAMYERDADGIPTGALLRPPPLGPWDDCFTELSGPPVLRWPGALELVMTSTCSHVVVYDEPDHAVCVEPQTGPPDAVNLGQAALLADGDELRATCTLRWDALP